MAKTILTAQMVRDVLHYDQETGIFTRKVRLAQRHQAGDRADLPAHGSLKGYRTIGMFGKKHLAHRVAWLYVRGEWPEMHLDHMNGIKSDNRIANLREVDYRLNIENQRIARKDSSTGMLGVVPHPGGWWRARIQVRGKGIHIGLFQTPEDAHAAYVVAKRKYHEGCTI